MGFSSEAQWVFPLQDVLSGFFFSSSVGFSSATQWGFLLQDVLLGFMHWPKQSFVDFGEL